MYKLIAVFHMFIAIPGIKGITGNDTWIVPNHNNLAPEKYVGVAWSYECIFAVSSY
jgi:hypothetical protein